MKRSALFGCAILVLLAVSALHPILIQGKSQPKRLVLMVGQTLPCPGAHHVTLAFQGVEADSRCPENVVCIRAGGVRLAMEARRGDDSERFTLDTDRGDGTAKACGLRFRLVKVEPGRPRGEALPPDRYHITVEVEADVKK